MLKKTVMTAFLVLGFGNPIQAQETSVEEEVEKLLEAVGGRDAWADAHGFIMYEVLYSANQDLPVYRQYWIDFKQPRIQYTSKGQGFFNRYVLNVDHGWSSMDGEIEDWEAGMVGGFSHFWRGIPTRVFHMLASNDPSIRAELRDDQVIDIYHNGERVVWIATDPEGKPVAYGREDRHTETHFLGELKTYGDVKLWDTATEPGGLWEVVMIDYELLKAPHTISYERPTE